MCGSCEEEEGRKQLGPRMFSLGKRGGVYFIHRFICLVKQLTVMTLFWETRDRAGPDFRHLLGCAAFLGQLAKRKLQSLRGMVVCLWFIPLELLEGRIYYFFLENLAGPGLMQGTCKW